MESPSTDRPADKLDLLESLDNFAGLRNGLRHVAERDESWAGIPMPLDGERLVIEPRYPNAELLSAIGAPAKHEPEEGIKLRNSFWSSRERSTVYVYEDEDGKVRCAKDYRGHHIGLELHTLGCSFAWGIEQEGRAVQLLGSMIRHHQMKQYLLTGMFLESSKRSGVMYLFRKLRPTVALRFRGDRTMILACLCMHPIAYYEGSWAGAMCPTDDVVAHLAMMRGDERLYWARCNQHTATRPEAGL